MVPHTLTVTLCYATYGRVLCGLFKAHICALRALNTSIPGKFASSQNKTVLAKYMSAALYLTNHCANTTRRGWTSGYNNCPLWWTIYVHPTLPVSEMRKPPCELAYSATYCFPPMLSDVIMELYDVLYLPFKYTHGIQGHPKERL